MGYSCNECIFCYINGKGNNPVRSYYNVCMTCFEKTLDPNVQGRSRSAIHNFDIFFDNICEVCITKKRALISAPACESCLYVDHTDE